MQPRPKTVRFKRFTAEHHSLELQLLSQLGLFRIDGLQRINADGVWLKTLTCSLPASVQVFRRADHLFGHHHQPPTVQQRAPDLPHR